MKKLVITGLDLDLVAVIALTGKTLAVGGRIYLIGGGVIPPGETTRYECGLYQIYETTSLNDASRVFDVDGRAVVMDDEKIHKGGDNDA